MQETGRYTISAVSRALKILKLFDADHRTMSLTELSMRAGITKSSALRVLESLESEGFVKRIEESKKYKLGAELFILSNTGFEFSSLKDIAEPFLKKAVDKTGLVAHMGINEDNKILFISRVWPESHAEGFAMASTVGGDVPVHCTGIGKVLTAFSDPETQEKLLKTCDYRKYTEQTITSEEKLREELAGIRQRGYGVNREEHEAFVSCITYPVFNRRRKVIAAISLTGLTQLMNQMDQDMIHMALREVTGDLAREAGYWQA